MFVFLLIGEDGNYWVYVNKMNSAAYAVKVFVRPSVKAVGLFKAII